MAEVITVQDLETLKKHEIFEAEVITGKAGGLTGGADIPTATNPVTGQVQTTLPEILRRLGFKPAGFTFVTGGTLNVGDHDLAVYNPAPNGDDNWYAWGGALPKAVPAGSTPQTTGGFGASAWTAKTDSILRPSAIEALRRSYAEVGLILVDGSFEKGGTVSTRLEVLLYEAEGVAYSWGAPAKTVPAGSTPATTGGLGDFAWTNRKLDSIRPRVLSLINNGYELLAHRGFMSLSVQDTMLAFTHAVSIGCRALEIDVQMSSDGVPVIIHDDTVDGTTDGTGFVKDMTLAQLKALNAGAHSSVVVQPARIPTLDEVVQFCISRGVRIYAEVKGYRTQSDIDIMLAVVAKYHAQASVVWQCDTISDLHYLRDREKISGVSYPTLDLFYLATLSAVGGEAYMSFDKSIILANPTWVDICKANGVGVIAYVSNDGDQIRDLLDIGVTKIMSDKWIGTGV